MIFLLGALVWTAVAVVAAVLVGNGIRVAEQQSGGLDQLGAASGTRTVFVGSVTQPLP